MFEYMVFDPYSYLILFLKFYYSLTKNFLIFISALSLIKRMKKNRNINAKLLNKSGRSIENSIDGVKKLVPARSTLSDSKTNVGVTIKPTILERQRVNYKKLSLESNPQNQILRGLKYTDDFPVPTFFSKVILKWI